MQEMRRLAEMVWRESNDSHAWRLLEVLEEHIQHEKARLSRGVRVCSLSELLEAKRRGDGVRVHQRKPMGEVG